jgi:uncharacterized membrane protein YhaH (DUF805 family)
MKHFLQAFRKYAQFSGRAKRAEFWWFFVLATIFCFLLAVVDSMIGTYSESLEMGLLSTVFGLSTIVPTFSVGARRLHDVNSSGWWQLLLLVPLFGALFLIYLMLQRGAAEENRFGPPPAA